MVRTIAAIGDVHGQVSLLQAALDAAVSRVPDVVVCVGDVASNPQNTELCCQLLASRGVLTCRGNHDRWFLSSLRTGKIPAGSVNPATLRFLEAMPSLIEFESECGRTIVFHGVAGNDLGRIPSLAVEPYIRRLRRLEIVPKECSLMIHGHEHGVGLLSAGGIAIVGVGALDSARSSGCVLVDTSTMLVSRLPY